MSTRIEGTLAIVAALIVLFSAMWDPRVSAVVAVLALTALGLYRLLGGGRPPTHTGEEEG